MYRMSELLALAVGLPQQHIVYVPEGCVDTFSESTRCLVLAASDLGPGMDVPDAARELGYVELLQVADVADVVLNLEDQLARRSTATEQLAALKCFVENDAFIEAQ